MKVPHKQIDNNKKSQSKHLLRQENNTGAQTASTRLSTGSNIIASRIMYRPQHLIITFCLMRGEVKI
jgi:hypothetical protein